MQDLSYSRHQSCRRTPEEVFASLEEPRRRCHEQQGWSTDARPGRRLEHAPGEGGDR